MSRLQAAGRVRHVGVSNFPARRWAAAERHLGGDGVLAADLVGRHLIGEQGTFWSDGPLTRAVREGAICYLDEVVEARQDTTVVIHPLTDARRMLPLEKKGEMIEAHPDFQIVISYNPGYQSLMKDLKQSTKQRFGGLDFSYPDAEVEAEIVAHEAGVLPVAVQPVDKARHGRGAQFQFPAVGVDRLGVVFLSFKQVAH